MSRKETEAQTAPRHGDRNLSTRRRSATFFGLGLSDGWFMFLFMILSIIGALRSYQPDPRPFDKLVSASDSRTALLLTAHPDDEAMFFSPTIRGLVKDGWDVRGLCLSVGNGDGLGDIRREELFASYDALGVPIEGVQVLDDLRFQDGMRNHWDPREVAQVVQSYLDKHDVSLIITFDSTGITQHPNHTPLPASLDLLPPSQRPSVLHLHSPSAYTKFTGPIYPILLVFRSSLSKIRRFVPNDLLDLFGFSVSGKQVVEDIVIVSSWSDWIVGWKAMLRHRSQLVWFRWLYLLFSRLMWMNELIEVSPA